MSIAVTTALQAINATIDGIKKTPTDCPGYINTSEMPLVFAWCGPADHNTSSFQHLTTARTWWVRIYVKPLGQGRGVDQGYQEAMVFLPLLRQEYATQEHTSNTAWDCLRVVGDSGVAIRTLHDAPTDELYWTVEIQLEITHFTSA